jgi:hypothetical protein
MDDAFLNEVLEGVARRAATYAASIQSRRVVPTFEDVARLRDLDHPLPAVGSSAEDVIARLDAIGSPATVASTGGRYFGLVTGGALPVTIAANWLATA